MAGFHKDKATNKWFCDRCGLEVAKEIIFAPYNYFGENKEHHCEDKEKN